MAFRYSGAVLVISHTQEYYWQFHDAVHISRAAEGPIDLPPVYHLRTASCSLTQTMRECTVCIGLLSL